MRRVVEGSYAIADAVRCCSPDVVSVYPITPQTHIVEHLSEFVADGKLDCEYINVESEFSSLSSLIGASVAGARTYTSTTSQGLALMFEVLYNVSGMRLPIVMTTVNRSLSAPLSIWNDQQDSLGVRDSGWIQIYAENVQEAIDLTPMLYKISEDPQILTPSMVCMDGFILTHVYEPVDFLDEEMVREFLPPYRPEHILDPENPKTFGAFADPSWFTEFKYLQYQAMERSREKIAEVTREFEEVFGRGYGGLIDTYAMDDAEIALVTMGSIVGTVKEAIDDLRSEGVKVGLVKIRSYRPFPGDELKRALKDASVIASIEKDISMGYEGALLTDLKGAFYNSSIRTPIIGFAVGLGGRDIGIKHVRAMVERASRVLDAGIESEFEIFDVKPECL
ncbi:MAG: pyruvate synthase subunit PorA [Methanothrix sp.]|jgi:pyruvate ferredoxin oxidoreductase alpha subunit|uniref:Pyruvate synthase subunit PorA n=1 Tax=Methanothrix harundinacea TaxID=301375 RepID=A0A117LFH4_9EURY|nr:MAG: Pyruvate:ferredoxin oxidoreductase subunit A [Methanothrix harundinacea]KUK96602.1 MAG: Pyruvate:ferredoxin oxidoreductase subunit A [Methanothrix harundinacea]MCP1392679.1 pyruvate ferredoxin oxidoreductase [Methanothrix harundinacea]MDD3709650.1 pyruvate synthase subunit PorA [Methanothrix sp.]MDI9400174.1 pyruvate synthase subunit PorA [Euryarchaeota archaeon]